MISAFIFHVLSINLSKLYNAVMIYMPLQGMDGIHCELNFSLELKIHLRFGSTYFFQEKGLTLPKTASIFCLFLQMEPVKMKKY